MTLPTVANVNTSRDYDVNIKTNQNKVHVILLFTVNWFCYDKD